MIGGRELAQGAPVFGLCSFYDFAGCFADVLKGANCMLKIFLLLVSF